MLLFGAQNESWEPESDEVRVNDQSSEGRNGKVGEPDEVWEYVDVE